MVYVNITLCIQIPDLFKLLNFRKSNNKKSNYQPLKTDKKHTDHSSTNAESLSDFTFQSLKY